MTKSTTYFENNSTFTTYKLKQGGEVRILIKKDGKPHKTIRFNALTGKMKNPKDL